MISGPFYHLPLSLFFSFRHGGGGGGSIRRGGHKVSRHQRGDQLRHHALHVDKIMASNMLLPADQVRRNNKDVQRRAPRSRSPNTHHHRHWFRLPNARTAGTLEMQAAAQPAAVAWSDELRWPAAPGHRVRGRRSGTRRSASTHMPNASSLLAAPTLSNCNSREQSVSTAATASGPTTNEAAAAASGDNIARVETSVCSKSKPIPRGECSERHNKCTRFVSL